MGQLPWQLKFGRCFMSFAVLLELGKIQIWGAPQFTIGRKPLPFAGFEALQVIVANASDKEIHLASKSLMAVPHSSAA